MTISYQQVKIQANGRLNVDGGNGQSDGNDYYAGGGAGGIIQIIASEGSLAAKTSSMKRGKNSGLCDDAEEGYFLLKGNSRRLKVNAARAFA